MNDEILNDLRKILTQLSRVIQRLEPAKSEPQGNHIFSEKAEIDMATTEYMVNKHGLLAMCRRIADASKPEYRAFYEDVSDKTWVGLTEKQKLAIARGFAFNLKNKWEA